MRKWWASLSRAQKGWVIFGIGVAIIVPAGYFLTPVFRRMISKSKIQTALLDYQDKITQDVVPTYGVYYPVTAADVIPMAVPLNSDGKNNPLNLRFKPAKKIYEYENTPTGNTWRTWPFLWQGYRAGMMNVLHQAIHRTETHDFNDTLPILSPPNENNVPVYIKNVTTWSGIDPNADITKMSAADFKAMIKAMTRQEQLANFPINDDDINAAYASLPANLQNP